MTEGSEGSKKSGHGKNVFILFLVLIIFSGVGYYIYQDSIDNIIAESWYPSEVVYDFENDTIGEHPEGWSGTSWDGTEVILFREEYWILDARGIYNKVAEVKNRDGEGVEFATRFKKATNGVIKFDIYCDFDERVSIDITQMTSEHDPIDDIVIHLGGSSAIKIKDGNDNFVSVKSFFVERWYHFEIRFNMEYWEIWIDGEHVLVYGGYYINYFEQPPYFCELYFSTYVDDNKFYIDNVDIDVVPI